MCNLNLVVLIRNSMLNNPTYNFVFIELVNVLGCTRHIAKSLVFAWMHKAENHILLEILEGKR